MAEAEPISADVEEEQSNPESDASPPVPDHAHIVLVPLANPETAPDLLRIANAVVRADGGKVVALSVATGDADAEQAVSRMDELELVVEAAGDDIELLRRSSSTVARGILDAVREVGADMTVLGLAKVSGGKVELGRVLQSVIATATCDVLLYRPGRAIVDLRELDRVVVGVDESDVSRAAARVGVLLGEGLGCPVDVLTVQTSGRSKAASWEVLDRALSGVTEQERCRRRVVKGATVAAGLTTAADGDDLLIVGFEERSAIQEWIEGDVARRVLDRAAGPTIAVSRLPSKPSSTRLAQRVVDWLRPRLTDVEVETIDWRSQALAKTSLDYVTLIVVAAVLASLGLLLNSVAVIIGAMLVAPLMGPLVAFAIALRMARLDIVRQSMLTVMVGTNTAFGVSVLIGAIVPLAEPTSEMLARGSPSLLDAGVALASGLVGAYATARKDIPAALAGVAIAAALVPPICVSGLALGLGEYELALGAALLFTVNVVCIAAVGTGVFAWLGMKPEADANPGHRHITMIGGLLLPVLIGLLLAVGASRFTVTDLDVKSAVTAIIPTVEFAEFELAESDQRVIVVTVRGSLAPTASQVSALQEELRKNLDDPALRVEVAFVLLTRAT